MAESRAFVAYDVLDHAPALVIYWGSTECFRTSARPSGADCSSGEWTDPV